MEQNTSLYVLAKKEVALIFMFMILVAITSFAFGVKVGKNYSFKFSEVKQDDVFQVEKMLSKTEEKMEKIMQEQKIGAMENKKIVKDTYNKLKEEFDKLSEKEHGALRDDRVVNEIKTVEKVADTKAVEKSAKRDEYSGKHTVQLGSHKLMADAEAFADGFRVRGYNPIISEVKITGRGVWFRVSLGAFDTIESTKEFIIKEKSLFQGIDYVIARFD